MFEFLLFLILGLYVWIIFDCFDNCGGKCFLLSLLLIVPVCIIINYIPALGFTAERLFCVGVSLINWSVEVIQRLVYQLEALSLIGK